MRDIEIIKPSGSGGEILIPTDREVLHSSSSSSYFDHDGNGNAIGGSRSMNPDNKITPKSIDPRYIDFRIKDYMAPRPLHKKFLSGRDKPNFRPGSSIEKEWYMEQVDYMINGLTFKGRYINPLYYFFLNYMQFEVPVIKNSEFVELDVSYPTYCNMDNYIFDIMWQAKLTGWHVSLMGGRGIGKSYIFTTPLEREYVLFPGSLGIISGTSAQIVDEAWDKYKEVLRVFEEHNDPLKHKRIMDNDKTIRSGEVISDERGNRTDGYLSSTHKVIYANNPDATRGKRPNVQLIEEFAAFPKETSKGSLKNIFSQSEGSWVIGGTIRKAFVMLSGTGGSVENDEAKDLFLDPMSYRIYPINEWGGMSGIFIPVQYKLTKTWEKDGSPDVERALEIDSIERKIREKNHISYQNRIQEYPRTIEDVFKRTGSNKFNQTLIGKQWSYVMFEANENGDEENKFVKQGSLVWIKNEANTITGARFVHDNVGDIFITEEPELDPEGRQYEALYVMGVDSIDQGDDDSTGQDRDHSKLGVTVKKRFIENKINTSTSNVYVCYYNKRSDIVDKDFENVLKISWYYNAMINLEYTKIGILGYFRYRKQSWRFMRRPALNRPPNTDPEKLTSLIGTTTATNIIKHGDGKIEEYVETDINQMFFIPILVQLKEYDANNRTKYDLIVAMNLTEVADDDFAGTAATVEDENEYEMSEDIGYYKDKDGKKRYGVIPPKPKQRFNIGGHRVDEEVEFYEEGGIARFDTNYTDDTKLPIVRRGDLKKDE